MKTVIKMKCTDQVLELETSPVVASGGINEVEVDFTFDDLWDGFSKTAIFYKKLDNVYRAEIIDDKCVIPAIVLTEPGTLKIGVYGTDGNDRRTSSVISYHISRGTNADAPDPLEELKRQWTQEAVEGFLKDVRGSMKVNVGGDYNYTDSDLEYLLGTEPYRSGVLNEVARQIRSLRESFSPVPSEYDEAICDDITIMTRLEGFVKSDLVDAINEVLSTSYTTEMSWAQLDDVIRELPDRVKDVILDAVNKRIAEAIPDIKVGLAWEYCKVVELSRQDVREVIEHLDTEYGKEVTSLDEIPLWFAPVFPQLKEYFTNGAKSQDNEILVSDVNAVANEELLSYSAEFEENVTTTKGAIGDTIDAISSSMYNVPPENLTYTESVNRIEEVQEDLAKAVGFNIVLPYPKLVEQAKNAGYMQSIVDFVEAQTNFIRFSEKYLGSANQLLILPYFNTELMTFNMQGVSSPQYCKEIGFDMSRGTYTHSLMFSACTNLNKLILTGFDKRDTVEESKRGSLSEFFTKAKNVQEIYTDGICAGYYPTPTYQQMFDGLTSLVTIGGYDKSNRIIDNTNYGYIDFTGCNNTTNMFRSCIMLENVRFVPNTLTISLDLSAGVQLSKESAISAINACGTVTSATLKLSTLNPNIQDTDPDIASAIASATAKGWSVTYA